MGPTWEGIYVPNQKIEALTRSIEDPHEAIRQLISSQNDPIVRHRLTLFAERLDCLAVSKKFGTPDCVVLEFVREDFMGKKAKAAYDKAERELAKERPDNAKASKDLQDAVEQYPEFAAAWQRLGTLKLDLNDTNGASEAFRKAIAADPNFVPPCVSLASLELQLRKPDEAVKLADQALKLAPDLPEAHYYRGLANLSLGRHDDAEASLLVVQRSAEANRFPRTHVALGGILAEKGEVPRAAEEFRRYLELEPSSKVADSIRARLAEWQAAGKLK
jgi:tetratricopeptide (TPR) repeat protein